MPINPHHFAAGLQNLTMTSNQAGNLGLVVRSEREDVVTGSGVIVSGKTYKIATAGTTNFTLIGAADSNVGTEFTANATSPSGTGTVTTTRFYTITTQSSATGTTVGTWGDPLAVASAVVNTMVLPVGSADITIDVPTPDHTETRFYIYHTVLTGAGTNITLNTGSPTLASPMTFTSQLQGSADVRANVISNMTLDGDSTALSTTITGRQNESLRNPKTRPVLWKFNSASGTAFTIDRQPEQYDLGGISTNYTLVGTGMVSGGSRLNVSTTDAANIRVGMLITDNGSNAAGNTALSDNTRVALINTSTGVITTTKAILGGAYTAGDTLHFDSGWGVSSSLTASYGRSASGDIDNTTLIVSGSVTVDRIGDNSIDGSMALNPGNFVTVG